MERNYRWRGHTHKGNIHTDRYGDIRAEGLTHGRTYIEKRYIYYTDCTDVLDYLFGGLST